MFGWYRQRQLVPHSPWMHPREIVVITSRLSPEHIMLEWGSGGSTIFFSGLVKRLYSIEHSRRWFKAVQKRLPPNVTYLYVKQNGKRTKPTQYAQFKDYIEACARFGTKFDRVLIDGRARPECAEFVLPYLNPGAVVFIHDYFSARRTHYRRAENFYDVIEKVDDTEQTIIALSPKAQG